MGVAHGVLFPAPGEQEKRGGREKGEREGWWGGPFCIPPSASPFHILMLPPPPLICELHLRLLLGILSIGGTRRPSVNYTEI